MHRRPAICDGAGLNSTADHSNPKREALPGLTDRILTYVRKHNLDNSILCHIAQSKPDHPIAAHHQHELVHIVHSSLHPDCCNPNCTAITAGQPFRLELVGALAAALKDPDAALHNILREGVPTGIFSPIQPSMQWPRKQDDLPCDAPDDIHLLHCSGNWTRAEDNPQIMAELIEAELKQGWIAKFPGSRADAQQQWPSRTAIGKLNVVLAEGKDPRLVLDSTVCNANVLCRIPEQVALPSSLDVRRSFLCSDLHGAWTGIALDVKAAHKRIKVSPAEQGALLFEWQGTLCYYTVCHFGANSQPTGGKGWEHCSADCYTAFCRPHRIASGCM